MAGNYYHGLSAVERWSYDVRVALRAWLVMVVLCGAAAAVVLGVTLGVTLGERPDPAQPIMGVSFR